MILYGKKVYLRDMTESDLEDYARWLTADTEWQNWDAPWEVWTPEETQSYLQWRREQLARPLRAVRSRFEICTNRGEHIGWLACYPMDGDSTRPAVGIDIPEPRHRGQGRGREAFSLFCRYIAESYPLLNVFCQTWSGNAAMMALARSVGFELWQTQKDARPVRGKCYDALTYILKKQ